MKKILILSAVFFFSTSCLAQQVSFNELDSSQYFDFWEGIWEGTWPEGDEKGKAVNQLTWIAGGKVLQENFEIIEGQNKGFIGSSLSVFRPMTQQWKQAWADNQGGYFDFTGRFDGDNRIFQTAERTQAGKRIIQRMTFKNITQDSFTWDWEMSTDGGESWQLNWQIEYTRLETLD